MLRKSILASSLFLASASCAATSQAEGFTLSSPDLAEGQALSSAQVFQGFGCEGGNQSPALSWSGAPEGTKSFALTVYDPDAPTGSGWWHWSVVNIPSDTTSIAARESATDGMPKGSRELTNDYGTVGFGGACPPPGEVHRYQFTLHALGTERLDLPENASNALTGFMVKANAIDTATITAVYTR